MADMQTERLRIRRFRETDIEPIHELVYADFEVRRWWSANQDTVTQFYERFGRDRVWDAGDGFGYHAVVRREDDVLLGLMGFQRLGVKDRQWLQLPHEMPPVAADPEHPDTELTYALGRTHWGMGYATEAGRTMVEFGFGVLGIGRILNGIDPKNVRSRALMRRLGFTFLPPNNPAELIGVLVSPFPVRS